MNKTQEENFKHGKKIMETHRKNRSHNFMRENRKTKLGNEFDSKSAAENAKKRMADGTNYFCKLCCVDKEGNIIWIDKDAFYQQKSTENLVMNSSKEGKRRIMEKRNER